MIRPLFGVLRVQLDLMTLTLFQGHMNVGNMNCKFLFFFFLLLLLLLFSCPARSKHCMVATYVENITNNMLCVILCILKGENVHFFGWLSVQVHQNLYHCGFLGHYKCDKCQTLYDGTTY